MPIARKHRLPAAAYIGPKTVAITACTENRVSFLTDSNLVSEFVRQLSDCAARHQCLVPVYCFMPDHLHLMLQGTEDTSKPKQSMDDFKATSGLWLARNRPGCFWQDEYYDHIIRKHDDWRKQAFYILNNPVRKGLATDPFDFPFSGSIGYELGELFDSLCS